MPKRKVAPKTENLWIVDIDEVTRKGHEQHRDHECVLDAKLTQLAGRIAGVADALEPVTHSKWYRWRKDGTALIAYLMDS